MTMNNMSKTKGIGWNIFCIIITLSLLAIFIYFVMINKPYIPPIALGAFIIFLVSVLLGLLFMFSAGFHNLKMSDQSKALGMPEGSIRAVIAMSLLVIFVGIGIFIFHTVSISPYTITVQGMTVDEKTIDKIVKLTAGFTHINITESNSNITTTNVATTGIEGAVSNIIPVANADTIQGESVTPAEEVDKAKAGEGQTQAPGESVPPVKKVAKTKISPETFNLKVEQKPINDSAIQLAQQLISILGTLVVAIAGFYFGTRSVSVARGVTVPTLPFIRNMDPREQAKETDGGKVEAKINGKNFAAPQSVKLVLGSKEIMGEEIFSNDTLIKCNFNIKDKLKGHYDLVVMNQDGGEDRLSEAFEVKEEKPGE